MAGKVEARRASAGSRTRSALSATEALAAAVGGGGRSLRPRRAGSQDAGRAAVAVGVSISGGATSNLGPESPLRRSTRSGNSAGAARNGASNPNGAASSKNTRGRRRGNKNANNTSTLNHNIRPRRSTINYREDSSDDSDSASTTAADETDSDEDDGEGNHAQPPRRSTISTRGRPSRTQTQTQLSTTTNHNTRAATSSHQALGKRRRPRSGFFHEDSDGHDDTEDDDEIINTDHETLPTPRRGRGSVARARESSVPRTPDRKRRKGTPATATKGRTPASSKKPKLNLVHSDTEEDKTEKEPKVLLPWQQLPFQIWLSIFKYASAERDLDAVNLLLSASRLCKDLADPALTALYYSPPLLTRKMAHGLVSLLSSDPNSLKYRYKWKVKKLRIDVEEIASKTYKGQHLDWDALFANVPLLKSIDFYHAKDNAPFRSLETSLRWKYPAAMWRFLNGGDPAGSEHEPIKLEAWRWNGRLMAPEMTLQSPAIIHQTPAFSNLKKLCLQNFQVPSMPLHNWPVVAEDVREAEGFEDYFIGEFANAIGVLPQLEWLSIESSTIANDHLLRLLPTTLKTLELVNCWEITADDFSEYLLTRAHNLEHLYLRHNQSLSMSFLTVLGSACPFLQTLSVDLKTYNHHEFYNDSDPIYETVLGKEEVPDWPVSLRILELQNMRKWSAAAAENLFESLVKAARDLPDLRILMINAKLNIPIRQRSEMRDRWEARLKGVFLRKWEDPKPLFTLRPPPAPKKQLMPTLSSSKIPPSASKRSRTDKWLAQSIESNSTRRSARIAAISSGSGSGSSSNGGSPTPRFQFQQRRGFERETSVASSSLSLSADELSLTPREANVAGEILFRHGCCEKVELQLDNQKLTEQTLTMEDFMDGGGSGGEDEDSEWDGMDRDDDYGGGYAW